MENKHKTSSGKNILLTVLSFALSLTLVFLTFIVVSGVTLFSDKDILPRVSETAYFSDLNNEIVTRCRTIAAKSGVDYSSIESVITSNRVDADFSVYFNSITSENPHAGRETIDEKALSEELYAGIVSADPDITDAEKEEVRQISSNLAKEYKDTVILESFEKFIGFTKDFKSISRYVFFILCALFVYLICVIIYINGKKQKHRLFRKFAVVGGSAGLTVSVLSLIIKFSGIFEQISFASSQREYNLFMSFFDDFLNLSIFVGACWVAVCIVLLVLWYLSVTGRIRK